MPAAGAPPGSHPRCQTLRVRHLAADSGRRRRPRLLLPPQPAPPPRGEKGAEGRQDDQRGDHREGLGLDVDRRERPARRRRRSPRSAPIATRPQSRRRTAPKAPNAAASEAERQRRIGAGDVAADDPEVALRPDPERLAREDRRAEPARRCLDLPDLADEPRRAAAAEKAPTASDDDAPPRRSPRGGGVRRRARASTSTRSPPGGELEREPDRQREREPGQPREAVDEDARRRSGAGARRSSPARGEAGDRGGCGLPARRGRPRRRAPGAPSPSP